MRHPLLHAITLVFSFQSFAFSDRVMVDLERYDRHIEKRRSEFSKIPADIKNKDWVKKKLAFMYEIDQYMRKFGDIIHDHKYTKKEIERFTVEYRKRFKEMDLLNTGDLKTLLVEYEWFTISQFGKESDSNAWIIVQHADLDREFQKVVLAILEKLWKQGETSPSNYAYLFDRVAASWKDPSKRVAQRYGTQGSCVGPGKWEPHEIEDPQNVDLRRQAVGLDPMKQYIAKFKEICK